MKRAASCFPAYSDISHRTSRQCVERIRGRGVWECKCVPSGGFHNVRCTDTEQTKSVHNESARCLARKKTQIRLGEEYRLSQTGSRQYEQQTGLLLCDSAIRTPSSLACAAG